MAAIITFEEGERHLDWLALTDAFIEGHQQAKAVVADTFLYQGENTLLNRSAWITNMGLAVKCATIFPGNEAIGKASIGGAVNLFSGQTGELEAILDFHLVTKWKTAGDSLLGARRLARADSHRILLVGAGAVAHSLLDAYSALFPDADFSIWNRTPSRAKSFVEQHPQVSIAPSLEAGVKNADIISCATMATEPLIKGEWLQAGQHLDLIGAYRPDMREADDKAMQRGRLFVDSRESTIEHIGELILPLENQSIALNDVLADFYEINKMTRLSEDEITIFKNGGGAHLDLMTSRYILSNWRS